MIAINDIGNALTVLMPYVEAYKNKKQYEESKALLRQIMALETNEKTPEIISFAKMLAKQISCYEKEKYGFDEKVEPKELLAHLIKEHGLTQSDLPEIGSQSLVSKILKGERELTVEHIKKLSARFNISPQTWF